VSCHAVEGKKKEKGNDKELERIKRKRATVIVQRRGRREEKGERGSGGGLCSKKSPRESTTDLMIREKRNMKQRGKREEIREEDV